jgi:hypothetical protein
LQYLIILDTYWTVEGNKTNWEWPISIWRKQVLYGYTSCGSVRIEWDERIVLKWLISFWSSFLYGFLLILEQLKAIWEIIFLVNIRYIFSLYNKNMRIKKI